MSLSSLRQLSSYGTDPVGFLDQACVLCRACELAYEDDAGWIAESLDVPSVTTFPDATLRPLPNTQGFFFRHEGIAALVFRGSANRGHWISNFTVRPPEQVNHSWGTVHPGFSACLEVVVDSVLRPFLSVAADADIVWVSGHSLGGALAVLAAAWLQEQKGIVPALLTFGQPMPGFDDFRTRFDAALPGRLTRIINQSDIVPRLPGVGYAHCGRPKTITSGLTLEAFQGAAVTPPELADSAPPPATKAEFDDFLYELESGPLPTDEPAALEGMIASRIPWAAHHRCDRYLAQLQAIRQTL